MTLPHYKLHTTSEPQPFAQGAFPVIMVPPDPPQNLERIKNLLRSKKLLTALVMLSVLAGASLLWLALDPMLKAPKPALLLLPAATLGLCLLLFALIAVVRKGAETTVLEAPESELPLPALPRRGAPKPHAPQIEVSCEEWASQPFIEIIDEALLAEVFNDDMVAPDHIVVSIKVEE